MLAEAETIVGLVESLAKLGRPLASLAPYLLLAGIAVMLAAKLLDSQASFEAGRQASITGLIVMLLSCLDYARDPTLLGPLWELRRLRAALLGLACYGYERYEQRTSLKGILITWAAFIGALIAILLICHYWFKTPMPPWLPDYLTVADAGLSLARLIALLWLCASLARLALSARGGLGLLVGWADEYDRKKAYLYRRMYKPTRPKRNGPQLDLGRPERGGKLYLPWKRAMTVEAGHGHIGAPSMRRAD